MGFLQAAMLLALLGTAPGGQEPIQSSARFAPIEGEAVSEVRVIFPAGLKQADIMRLISVKKGAAFSIEEARRSIKLLFHTGKFGDISVFARREDGRLIIVFELHALVVISSITIDGNKSITQLEILRALNIEMGDEVAPKKIASIESQIKDLYQQAGFPEAGVSAVFNMAENSVMAELAITITEGPPQMIGEVIFDGPGHYPPAALSYESGLRAGERLDRRLLKNNVAALREFYLRSGYPMAYVGEPEISVDRAGLLATVRVPVDCGEETKIVIEGNRNVPASLLRSEIAAALKRRDRPSLSDAVKAVKEFLVSAGFPYSDVSVERIRYIGRDDGELRFTVSEGPQVLVSDIRFAGNVQLPSDDLKSAVKSYMLDEHPRKSIFETLQLPALESGGLTDMQGYSASPDYSPSMETSPDRIWVQAWYRKAVDFIADYYRTQGYLDVVVSAPDFEVSGDRRSVAVVYSVREGPRTAIGSLKFEKNEGIPSIALSLKARPILGKYVDNYKVEEARLALEKMYAEYGYVYADVRSSLEFTPDRKTADIVYTITEGNRVNVGNIVLQGNERTSDRVVNGNLTFKSGDVYKPSEVNNSQSSLLRLQIFQSASISLIDLGDMTPVKDVSVDMKERLPQSIEVIGGISTVDGARAGIKYSNVNLGGGAMGLDARLKLGYQIFAYIPGVLTPDYAAWIRSRSQLQQLQYDTGLTLNFQKIYGLPVDTGATIDIMNIHVIDQAYLQDVLGATPGLQFRFTRWFTLMLNYAIVYEFFLISTSVNWAMLNPSEQVALQTPNGVQWFGSLRPTFLFDWRDDKFNPHRGVLLKIMVDYSHSIAKPATRTRYFFDPFPGSYNQIDIGSVQDPQVNFFKVWGSISGYIPTSRRTTLALLVGGGTIFLIGSNAMVTPDARFFMGGRDTLRGINENAMFPADIPNSSKRLPGGQVATSAGGNAYVLYRSEFRFPIYVGFNGHIFLEAGNLWINPGNFNPLSVRPSTGGGVGYNTPVGPISIELGINLMPDKVAQEPVFVWMLSVGMF